MSEPKYDEEKLAELILLVASRLNDVTPGGTIRLLRGVFLCDFSHYLVHRRSITGARYRKVGCFAKPLEFRQACSTLSSRNDAEIRGPSGDPFPMIGPLRTPNLALFSDDELTTIDVALESLAFGAPDSVVGRLDQLVTITETGESIPYDAVFASRRHLTDREIRYGQLLAERQGLLADS